MHETTTIRAMRASDIDAVFSLWRRVSLATYTFLVPHTEEEDRAYFTRVIMKNNDVFVAEIDKRIRGYLAMKNGYIDRLYVDVAHQREGIGTLLIAFAKQRHPDRLRLHTHQKNVGACAFYDRQGFVATSYGVSPPPESEPDVLYEWSGGDSAASCASE